MKINILLPYKEQFDKSKLSSVCITVLNNLNHSKFKEEIRIFGRRVTNPAKPKNFVGIKNSFNLFKSRNLNLADQMCKKISMDLDDSQLIEIHNRPKLIKYVLEKTKNKYPINIFFHNNPLDMAGSKSLKERQYLIKNTNAILCVSEFIRDKFLTDFRNIPSNIHVLHNGVDRKNVEFPKKINEVLFVGRLVKEKGVELYINAVAKLATKVPNWKFCIVGSSHLGIIKEKSDFAKKNIEKFLNIGHQAYFTGYLSYKEVQKKMEQASIVVIPSIWEEPYGLVVAEAMSNGAAIITAFSGGIPEIVGSNGIVIKNINEKKIEDALSLILNNKEELNKYQQLSWKNFKHTSLKSSKKLDKIRSSILF